MSADIDFPKPPASTAAAGAPAVAIITRTKNRAKLLTRAAKSIVSQTFSDWVWVVVNDGGDADAVDASLEPFKKACGKRLIVKHNPESLGMEAAANLGVKASTSEFVVIHDDDDTWHPDFLKETVALLRSEQGANYGGCVTHTDIIHERIEPSGAITEIDRESFHGYQTHLYLYRELANNVFVPISFLFRRSCYDALQGFNESLPVVGDWEFNYRFLQHWEIRVLTTALAFWHQRVGGPGSNDDNTVTAGWSSHRDYDSLIRNQFLREEIAEGRVGLGFYLNQSRSHELVMGRIWEVRSELVRELGEIKKQLTQTNAKLDALARTLENITVWTRKVHDWHHALLGPYRKARSLLGIKK